MSQFHIAELARRGTVKKVAGSSPQHVAYQIGPAFNFRINTRYVVLLGAGSLNGVVLVNIDT